MLKMDLIKLKSIPYKSEPPGTSCCKREKKTDNALMLKRSNQDLGAKLICTHIFHLLRSGAEILQTN